MPLPFQPSCLPLLLGSLPHRSAIQALEASGRYAGTLLAWPQLPQRSFREQSLVQSAVGFPGLVVDGAHAQVYVDREAGMRDLGRLGLAYLEDDIAYAALSRDDAAGIAELIRQRDSLRGVLVAKGQLLGPISMAAQLVDEHQRPLLYDEVLFEAVAHHLYLRAAWQDRYLRDFFGASIVCLDEPFLDAVGMPFLPLDWDVVRGQIDTVLAGIRGCRGLYASGAVDWTQVLKTSVELIIADVHGHGQALVDAAPALAAFLERGGTVGLGLVPADEEGLALAEVNALVWRAHTLLRALEERGVPTDRLVRQAVISTSGGLGQLSIPAAERAMQLVAEVSAQLREQHGLA